MTTTRCGWNRGTAQGEVGNQLCLEAHVVLPVCVQGEHFDDDEGYDDGYDDGGGDEGPVY